MAIIDAKQAIWQLLNNEIERLKRLFPDRINAKVLTSYPRTVTEIDTKDIITIARVSSPAEDRFLGEILQQQLLEQQERMGNKYGTLEQDTWEIMIWSLNPQRRDQLYLLVRQILFEKKREELLGKYLFTRWYRIGGGDGELDVSKSGRTIYTAKLNYLSQTYLSFGTSEKLVESFEIIANYIFGDGFEPPVITTKTKIPLEDPDPPYPPTGAPSGVDMEY